MAYIGIVHYSADGAFAAKATFIESVTKKRINNGDENLEFGFDLKYQSINVSFRINYWDLTFVYIAN